jgi:hypothetical protein
VETVSKTRASTQGPEAANSVDQIRGGVRLLEQRLDIASQFAEAFKRTGLVGVFLAQFAHHRISVHSAAELQCSEPSGAHGAVSRHLPAAQLFAESLHGTMKLIVVLVQRSNLCPQALNITQKMAASGEAGHCPTARL